MWTRVTVDAEDVLRRYTAVLRDLEPLQRMYSFGSLLAQMRSSVAHERMLLFHFPGNGFELFLRVQHEPRLGRYLICPAFDGAIEAAAALDLMVEQAFEFARERQLDRLYAIEPKGLDPSPLTQLYAALREHPRVAIEVEANLTDCLVLKFAAPPILAGTDQQAE